ncbi:MAG: DUF4362 domain-containing protein [Clostridiales bacterium]|nr:DUF4362 domain-containing protein [Clostridiales bacterium]
MKKSNKLWLFLIAPGIIALFIAAGCGAKDAGKPFEAEPSQTLDLSVAMPNNQLEQVSSEIPIGSNEANVVLAPSVANSEKSEGQVEEQPPQAEINPSASGALQVAPLESLPDNYDFAQAEADGVYVNLHGTVSNQQTLDNFASDVESRKPSFLRSMKYTIEGDPIISDCVYDGESFTVSIDSTRDKFGMQEISTTSYKYMANYLGDSGVPVIVISNYEEFTQTEWETGHYIELN